MRRLTYTAADAPSLTPKLHVITLPSPINNLTLAIPQTLGHVHSGSQVNPRGHGTREEAGVDPGNGLRAIWAGTFGVLMQKMWSNRKEEHRTIFLDERNPLPFGSRAGGCEGEVL